MKFTNCAGQYERHALAQKDVAEWSAQWLEQDPSGECAVELGAGTGLFTRHLVERRFRSLHATDLSPAMVKLGALNVPEAEWSLLDAWQPSWPAQVDRLYSTSLLQWAGSPTDVLRRWRRLLRPDGRLLATFFIAGSLAELFSTSNSLSALTWRSVDEWLTHFGSAHWRVLRWRTWEDTQHFATAAAALRSVHRTGAVKPLRASTAQLRRLLSECQRSHQLPTGDIPLTWKALQIEAIPLRPPGRVAGQCVPQLDGQRP